jgi:hypothetical protein
MNLTQGDSRATVNSFKLYNFHRYQLSMCDSVEHEEETIVAGGVT